MSQASKKQFLNLKKGRWVWVVLAVLVLGVNMVLSQRGTPLPQEVVDLAEGIVEEALQPEPDDSTAARQIESGLSGADTSTEVEVFSAEPPEGSSDKPALPDLSESDAVPWADAEGTFDYYVLALSWEPAFCEYKPDKVECATQSADRYDAKNFVLHGLWPSGAQDVNYCDLSQDLIRQDQDGDWCDLPELALSETVQDNLPVFMPGAESCLERHEWYKHGVCAGLSPDAYFALSERFVVLFSETRFNHYVADRTGSEVGRGELLEQFDAEFGEGANRFLSLRCEEVDGTSLLTEIRLTLRKDLAELDDLGNLFPSESVSPQGSCPQYFTIDRAGLGN